MITLIRKAMSATIGMAVMPVSYTWRAIEIGRSLPGCGRVALSRPLGPPPARQLELQVLTGAPNLDAHASVCIGRGASALGVQVRLEEPEVLVGLARDAGEEVRAVGVCEPRGLVDPRPHLGPERGQRRGQRIDVAGTIADILRIGPESRSARDRRERAARRTAEGR